MIDRRRFVHHVTTGLLAGLVAPRVAWAQGGGAPTAGVQPLGERMWLITSGGTNVLALSTREGLVLVDSGAPDRIEALMSQVRQLGGGAPVKMVFNTHFHPENTGGNEALHGGGTAIVAHENTRVWMATPVWVPAEDRYRQPRPAAVRPTETFRAEGSKTIGAEHIDYGYLIEAHTTGDIYVRLRESNVLAVGDVASPERDPELDYFTGAWIGGRVDAMDRALALCDDRTRIVPGFGPVLTKAQLQAERDVMKTVYDRTVDRVREGDDARDMLAAGVLKDLARTWSNPQRFLYDVQKGLWAHHNKLSPNVV
jgi:cyclase